ncbi:MAG TPA: hypothetical protein VFZ73_05580 [Gemmatimonadaceae bacterium]
MTTPTLPWRVMGAATAVIAAIGLRWSNAATLGSGEGATSQLRLSFSARPERIERCVELSDAELAKLPAHMRLRTKCEGVAARYLLTIDVDGSRLTSDTLRGGGLRHDRPLHVFAERGLQPGERRLRIEVSRLGEGAGSADRDSATAAEPQAADTLLGGRAEREREERSRRTAEAMPQRLVLDTVLNVPSMRVVLVTFDNNARRLVARMEP